MATSLSATPAEQKIIIGLDATTGRPLRIADAQRRQGTYVIGLQGMGKSSFLLNLLLQDIASGRGLCLIDPHRELLEDLLARADLPPDRVVLLDPADYEHPFGLNLFECADTDNPITFSNAASAVMDIFLKLWGPDGRFPSWGTQIESILRHVINVFIETQHYTLVDVPKFLENSDFRASVLRNVSEEARSFWEDHYNKRKDHLTYAGPTLNRVRTFTDHKLLSFILGQSKSTVNFSEAMDEGKIVLVPLPEGEIGKEGVTLIGSLITGQIVLAMLRRVSQNRLLRQPFALYCDEFALIATADFRRFFAEGRKFGLQTMVAHQHRNQLDRISQNATAAVSNRICFRLSPPDAKTLSTWFNDSSARPSATVTADPLKFLIDNGHPNPIIRRYINSLYRKGYELAQEYQTNFANPDSLSDLQMYNLQRTGKWNLLEQRRISTYLWAQAVRALNAYLYAGMAKSASYPSAADQNLYYAAARNLILALANVPELPRFPADPWKLPKDLLPSKYQLPSRGSSPQRWNAYDQNLYQTEELLQHQEIEYRRTLRKFAQSLDDLSTATHPLIVSVYTNPNNGGNQSLVAILRSILYLRQELAKSPLEEPSYKETRYPQFSQTSDAEAVLRDLPEHHALVTFGMGTRVKQARIRTIKPPDPDPPEVIEQRTAQIRAYAHQHYTKPRDQVQQEIHRRQHPDPDPQRRRVTRVV